MVDVDVQALRHAAESTAHALDDLVNRATPAGTIDNHKVTVPAWIATLRQMPLNAP
jgi:hypothetical protein